MYFLCRARCPKICNNEGSWKSLKNIMGVPVTLLFSFSLLPSTLSQVVVHHTSYKGICTNACDFHGYDYTWCKQSGGSGKSWDYCSLEEGLGHTGEKCATMCDLWGGSYHYCYLKNGEWNYCGLISEKGFAEYAQDNKMCFDGCRATKEGFHCNTGHGKQRCSPFHDVTPTGLPCHNNYRCAKYGTDGYRCHMDNDQGLWDYCGRRAQSKCVWEYSETNSSLVEICKLPTSHHEGKILFRRERRDKMLPLTKEEFKKAVHLIDKIASVTSLPDSEPLETVRFYKQEDIFCKGVNYTGVELEIGMTKESAMPIAHVLFPEFLNSVEILRLAFYTSLHSTFYQPAYTIAISVEEPMLCSTDHQ
uniref:Uncharacterized protein n=1 Tax=Podarcis muralis TaxID=64176 RepID=A0A670JJ72_PODMU